jgi:hypothetical protein
MPASFKFYGIPDDVQDTEIFVFSPNTYQFIYTRFLYSDPECTNRIGSAYYDLLSHNFNDNNSLSGNAFIKFFPNSGVPQGDDNILVISGTNFNKVVNGKLKDGTYTFQVNSTLSSGEWSGQVGYVTEVKSTENGLNFFTFNFPLPTLTYTNAFNSLPQPSTAPFPA